MPTLIITLLLLVLVVDFDITDQLYFVLCCNFAASEHDTVNEAGNYCIADEYVVTDISDNAQLVAQQQRWDLNYREAAIYLEEGENNDKFSAHPCRQVHVKCK